MREVKACGQAGHLVLLANGEELFMQSHPYDHARRSFATQTLYRAEADVT